MKGRGNPIANLIVLATAILAFGGWLAAGAVSSVGPGEVEPLPSDVAARPVALTRLGGAHELGILHRGHPSLTVRSAVVGDPRLGADPRSAQHDDASACDQLRDGVEWGRPGGGDLGVHRPSMRQVPRGLGMAAAGGARERGSGP